MVGLQGLLHNVSCFRGLHLKTKKKCSSCTGCSAEEWRISSGFIELYNEMLTSLIIGKERMKCTYTYIASYVRNFMVDKSRKYRKSIFHLLVLLYLEGHLVAWLLSYICYPALLWPFGYLRAAWFRWRDNPWIDLALYCLSILNLSNKLSCKTNLGSFASSLFLQSCSRRYFSLINSALFLTQQFFICKPSAIGCPPTEGRTFTGLTRSWGELVQSTRAWGAGEGPTGILSPPPPPFSVPGLPTPMYLAGKNQRQPRECWEDQWVSWWAGRQAPGSTCSLCSLGQSPSLNSPGL